MKKIIKLIYPHLKNKNFIERIIKKCEKGEYWSETLREIYKEQYDVEIGIGTYGCFKQEKYKNIKKIGNYCSIAYGLEFFPRNHPKNYASTHPLFFNTELEGIKDNVIEFNKLVIGNDVWVGQDVKITSKCNFIGNGAIIGAGSVVTKDVEPYSIVAGNPATIKGKRFSNDTIELLEKSKWYDLSPKELLNYIELVDKPEKFAKKIIEDYERK